MKFHNTLLKHTSVLVLVGLATWLVLTPVAAFAGPTVGEGNAALAEQYFGDVLGKGDMTVGNAILASEFQRIDRSQAATPLGKAGMLFLADYLHRGFSDATFTIDAVVVGGDTVAVCWTARGTNDGSYGFLPATNKPLTWTGMSFLSMKDGKIVQEMTNLENVSALLGDQGELRLSPSYAQ